MPCIYKFENKLNGKIYIGQTVDIKRRLRDHRNATSESGIFHKAIKKYGFDGFEFSILEKCSESELSEREEFWIDKYKSMPPGGYNLIKGDIHGRRSDETRLKQSAAGKEKYKCDKYRSMVIDRIMSMAKDPDIQKKKSESLKRFYKTKEGRALRKKLNEDRKMKGNSSSIKKLLRLCKDPEFIKERSKRRRSKVIYSIERISDGKVFNGTIYEITTEIKIMTRVDFSLLKSGKQKTARGWKFLGEIE